MNNVGSMTGGVQGMSENYNPDSMDAVVARIETTINSFIVECRSIQARNDQIQADLAKEVSALKAFKWWLMGAAAAAGATAGKIASFLKSP